MTDEPETITLNAAGGYGYAYHPARNVWVAYTPDTAERIDKPDDIDLSWDGDVFRFTTSQTF